MKFRNYLGGKLEFLGRKIKGFVLGLTLNYSILKTPRSEDLQEPESTGLARLTASLDSAEGSWDVQQVKVVRRMPTDLPWAAYYEKAYGNVANTDGFNRELYDGLEAIDHSMEEYANRIMTKERIKKKKNGN